MGLDMYLTKKAYVKNWSHMLEEEKHEVTIKKGGKLLRPKLQVKYIDFEAGYWRKANQIHKWFVDNVQDGEDDCREYWVSTDQLKELLNTVKTVIAGSKLIDGEISNGYTFEDGKRKPNMEEGKLIEDPSTAIELLPVEAGFFFGGTTYDQWYYQDLVDTKEMLEKVFADDTIKGDYYYQSSW